MSLPASSLWSRGGILCFSRLVLVSRFLHQGYWVRNRDEGGGITKIESWNSYSMLSISTTTTTTLPLASKWEQSVVFFFVIFRLTVVENTPKSRFVNSVFKLFGTSDYTPDPNSTYISVLILVECVSLRHPELLCGFSLHKVRLDPSSGVKPLKGFWCAIPKWEGKKCVWGIFIQRLDPHSLSKSGKHYHLRRRRLKFPIFFYMLQWLNNIF